MRTAIPAILMAVMCAGGVGAQPEKKKGLSRAEVEALLKLAALPNRHEIILRRYLENLPPDSQKEQIDRLREAFKKFRSHRPMNYGLPHVDMSDARLYNRLKVRLEAPTEKMIIDFGLPENLGQMLGDIYPGTPAAAAGFRAADILLEFNGQTVPADTRAFAKALNVIPKGAPVRAVVLRKGETVTVERVVFADLPVR